jgi:S-ribosylhomocysteine lyase LuxS involved in autoinducer biosynthesis
METVVEYSLVTDTGATCPQMCDHFVNPNRDVTAVNRKYLVTLESLVAHVSRDRLEGGRSYFKSDITPRFCFTLKENGK